MEELGLGTLEEGKEFGEEGGETKLKILSLKLEQMSWERSICKSVHSSLLSLFFVSSLSNPMPICSLTRLNLTSDQPKGKKNTYWLLATEMRWAVQQQLVKITLIGGSTERPLGTKTGVEATWYVNWRLLITSFLTMSQIMLIAFPYKHRYKKF